MFNILQMQLHREKSRDFGAHSSRSINSRWAWTWIKPALSSLVDGLNCTVGSHLFAQIVLKSPCLVFPISSTHPTALSQLIRNTSHRHFGGNWPDQSTPWNKPAFFWMISRSIVSGLFSDLFFINLFKILISLIGTFYQPLISMLGSQPLGTGLGILIPGQESK